MMHVVLTRIGHFDSLAGFPNPMRGSAAFRRSLHPEEKWMRSTDLSWDEQTRADGGRLWAGGAATALVAAGVALVGVLVVRKMLDSTVLIPGGGRDTAGEAMTTLPIAAALITLLATGLLHLLMTTTPQAGQFFGWIAGLALALIVLQVFLGEADLLIQVQTAVLYLLIGVAIISSLFGVSRTAVRYHRRQDYREGYSDERGYRQEPAYRSDPRRYR
jgi:uncharacterized protein DUF6069